MAAHRTVRSSSTTSLAHLRLVADSGPDHPARLAALALRSRSPVVLDALVECAGGGPQGIDRLRTLPAGSVPAPMLSDRTGPYTVALATALAGLRPGSPDAHIAVALAAAAADRRQWHWWWPRAATVAVQNAVLCGARDEAARLLEQLPELPLAIDWGIRADLAHPYLPAPPGERPGNAPVAEGAHAAWEQALSVPFARAGLAPLQVDRDAPTLFDGLGADAQPGSVDGPPVTVVMPTFAPDEGLLTAVRSLLAQSYGNLEILLVDDCSGADYADRYAEAAALDSRITLVQMPVNGGSYLGRNAAMARATGDFITFQDGDDWSHPERVARQVAALRKDPTRPASMSRAIRATDDLGYTWLGFSPQRDNASSLLLTRATLEHLGPFQRVRKGADSEYHKRIEAVLGELAYVRQALAVTRLRGGSLSRADFTLDWHVPDRVNYRNVFGHWHRTRAAREIPLRVAPDSPQPFPPPRSFLRRLPGEEPRADRFGLGYLLDASLPGPLPGVEPIFPASPAGSAGPAGSGGPAGSADPTDPAGPAAPPAVIHREDFGLARARWQPFTEELLELVQTGAVDLVSTTDEVHLDTLVVLSPGALELTDDVGVSCSTDRVVVVVPLPDQQGRFVDLLQVSDTCETFFGVRPTWAALDTHSQQQWAEDGWDLPRLADVVATPDGRDRTA